MPRRFWLRSVLAATLVATALSLAPATAAHAAAPAFVQIANANPAAPQSTVSVAFGRAEAAGDTNIIAIDWTDTTASVTGVSDSAGDAYHAAVATFRGNGLSQAVYYATGITAGATTVTVTFDRVPSFVDLSATEYSGVGAFDAGASASGATGDGDSGAVTTSNANDLLFAAGMSGGAFTAAGSGYTSREITVNGDLVEDRTVTATGAYHATGANIGPWLLQLAAFKATGGTSGAPAAGFTATPVTGTAPLPVTFTDTSTGTPTAWSWTFGDGGTSTARNPTHTYTAAGTYTVSLTATNAAGANTATRTAYITVTGAPTTTGWPDATNTGVPAGTALTPYTGPCTITTSGTVIDAKTVGCDLVIQAANVTVSRSKVNGLVAVDTDVSASASWSLTMTDSEVDAGVRQIAAICCGNLTLLRVNAHGGQTATQCEETSLHCLVTDSWLHGQQLPDGANWHLGGFLSDGTRGAGCTATWCIELDHNSVVCDHPVNDLDEGCSGDINLIPNFATMSKVRVFDNYLRANPDSAYCTYGGEKSTSAFPHGDHVTYQDNVFERGPNRLCAGYGPVTDFNVTGPGNQWLNNTWADDGTAVAPD